MPTIDSTDVPDKDLPLRDDIRLLGRILGDTVRDQEGEAVFEIVERIRQTSIRFHRDEDETARRKLGATLDGLSCDQTAGISRSQLQTFFDNALVSPVLTAHPTEVRRKSTIDREMEVAKLLDERDRIQL